MFTYIFGVLEIHWWLSTSANRTTIFENLTAYGDMAVWLTVAASYQADRAPAPETAAVDVCQTTAMTSSNRRRSPLAPRSRRR